LRQKNYATPLLKLVFAAATHLDDGVVAFFCDRFNNQCGGVVGQGNKMLDVKDQSISNILKEKDPAQNPGRGLFV